AGQRRSPRPPPERRDGAALLPRNAGGISRKQAAPFSYLPLPATPEFANANSGCGSGEASAPRNLGARHASRKQAAQTAQACLRGVKNKSASRRSIPLFARVRFGGRVTRPRAKSRRENAPLRPT